MKESKSIRTHLLIIYYGIIINDFQWGSHGVGNKVQQSFTFDVQDLEEGFNNSDCQWTSFVNESHDFNTILGQVVNCLKVFDPPLKVDVICERIFNNCPNVNLGDTMIRLSIFMTMTILKVVKNTINSILFHLCMDNIET